MQTQLHSDTNERTQFRRRAVGAVALLIALATLLLCHLAYLQIYQHNRYKTLSLQNQMNFLPLEPTRGLIYDRHGVLLAMNKPIYSLAITPTEVTHLQRTLKELATLIPVSASDLQYFNKQKKRHKPFEPSILRARLTEKEMAIFSVNQHRFEGVSIHAELIRDYPLGDLTAHVVGHVGRINEAELKTLDTRQYAATQYVGKMGIEKYYETLLHGSVGYDQIETDARGRLVRKIQRIPPQSGKDLTLTIDSRLTQTITQALGEHKGAVVAIDPKTGEVLALVSQPSFNPNRFVSGLKQTDVKLLHQNPDRPLHNRAIRGFYPPGSTVKPFIGLAALAMNFVSPEFSIQDPGWFKLPRSQHLYRDWIYSKTQHGHGMVNLKRAIAVSCDVYFYQLGLRLGIERLNEVYRRFGFGQRTGIDLPGELDGLLPNPEWKKANRHASWYPGDTVNISIGQGFLLTSPLQLAVATATFAMKGLFHTPHLLRTIIHQEGRELETVHWPAGQQVFAAEPKHWAHLFSAMQAVLQGEGTARARFGGDTPYSIAAKTGTVQVFSFGQKKPRAAAQLPYHLRDHSFFIVFAPIEDPRIALAILIEHDALAPQIARVILDAFFREKNR